MVQEIEERTASPTRRRMLQASVAGAASAAGLTSTAGAAEACDVTEDDKAAVREEYGTQEQLIEAIQSQDELCEALIENDLVEGEDDAVLIYAPVADCEPIPEYRIYRQGTEDRNLTIQLRPNTGGGYVSFRPHDPDDFESPCHMIWAGQSCGRWCYEDSCCSCVNKYSCGCEGAQVPCDPIYCCTICECDCDWLDCPQYCDLPDPAPDPIPVEAGWLLEALEE